MTCALSMSASGGRALVRQPSVTSVTAGTGQVLPGVDVTPGSLGEGTALDTMGAVEGGLPVDEGQPSQAAADWTPPSWDDVVRDHSARVYRLAYRLTGNTHDAEDLTQEVFVRVFRSLSSYTP